LADTFRSKSLAYEELHEAMKSKVDQLLGELLADVGEPLAIREYSHDPRNTDHAWVETTVAHLHDSTGRLLNNFGALKSTHFTDSKRKKNNKGVVKAMWKPVHRYQKLFASHTEFIHRAAVKQRAFW
jgi:hypothetical protein